MHGTWLVNIAVVGDAIITGINNAIAADCNVMRCINLSDGVGQGIFNRVVEDKSSVAVIGLDPDTR